ncbi:GGDEF domain-containing protein [Acidisoma cladoniae]|uniref:GGDEF domain-containing protein n=1 Tax=Acidisoma cladoniae TaxID=3040935 RepID=UPI00254B9947|nr:GGDEF domain-containing protein [Acidisoma sp. PAMC 29798]
MTTWDDTVIRRFMDVPPTLLRAWDLSCTGEVEAALAIAQRVHGEAMAAGFRQLRAAAACHMAWYCLMLAYYEEGILHALSAREVFGEVGDRPREAWARGLHAWLLIEIGAPTEALDEAMLSLERAETSGEERVVCFSLNVVGVVFWMLRQLDRALEFAERSVALARQIGDEVDLGRWLINLAGIEAEFGYVQTEPVMDEGVRRRMIRAVGLGKEALALSNRTGDSWGSRIALCNIAEYQLCLGEMEEAGATLAGWHALRGGDGMRSRLYYLFAKGKLAMATADHDAAIAALAECATIAEDIGDLEIGAPCCRHLAEAYAQRGRFAEALQWHREFHARHVRKATDVSLIRSRVAAIQYETRQLQARIETERSRADALEHMNEVLVQEAQLLMNASMEDALTGLPNRRRLERALLDISVDGGSYACAMMDIDNFKRVNDAFSHAIGDDVLRRMAILLRQATRSTDLLFRYGGEEFVVLMAETNVLLATKICQRIHAAVREWGWDAIQPSLRVTLSIGVAVAEEARTPGGVMAIADQRLYRAKEEGRDRIVMDDRRVDMRHLLPPGSPLLH